MSVDIVGKVYERFRVDSITTKKTKQGSKLYLCICNCGNEFYSIKWDLENGKVVSCGCYRSKGVHRKDEGIAEFNRLYRVYKRHAKNRGYAFDLTSDEFQTLTKGSCYYCGKAPATIAKSIYNSGDYVYNGVDRKDNAKGYTADNAVSCCKTCNAMKSSLGYDEFINACKSIAERF